MASDGEKRMTFSLAFWYYFSITGILLFIASVVITYTSYFMNAPQFMKISLALTLIGVFMIYFGIWRGDKVVELRHNQTIGEKNDEWL